MKKIFILFLSFGILSVSLLFPDISKSQEYLCSVYPIQTFTVSPVNVPPSAYKVSFKITVSPKPSSSYSLYIFINIDYDAAGQAHSYNDIPPTLIDIGTDGAGYADYTLPNIYNGTYSLNVSENLRGDRICNAPDARFIISGRQDTPSQGNCTRNLGDACIPGATDGEICDLFNNYCGIGPNGWFLVQKRTCDIGGGCCREAAPVNLNGPPTLVKYTCRTGVPSEQNDKCVCNYPPPEPLSPKQFCDGGGNPTSRTTSGKLWTAVGCIPIDAITTLTSKLMQFAIGVAGGIGVFLIIIAGFQFITAQGDRYKVKSAREILTSAIVGILMIIFSVFLLRLIGVNILGVIK